MESSDDVSAPPPATQQFPFGHQTIAVFHGVLKKNNNNSSIFHMGKKKHSKFTPDAIFKSVFHKKKPKHTTSIFHMHHPQHKKHKKQSSSILHGVFQKNEHSSIVHIANKKDHHGQKKHPNNLKKDPKRAPINMPLQKKDLKQLSSALNAAQKKNTSAILLKKDPKNATGLPLEKKDQKKDSKLAAPATSESLLHSVLQKKKGAPPPAKTEIVEKKKKRKWTDVIFRKQHICECNGPVCTPCFVKKPTIRGFVDKLKGVKEYDVDIQTTISEDMKKPKTDINIQTVNANE